MGMRSTALVAAAVAALILGVAPALAAAPVEVSTSVSTRFLFFGDPVTARVIVLADRRQVDPAGVGFTANFGGWTQLARTRVTTLSAGPFVRRSWSFEIACLQTGCLPNGRRLTIHLPRLTITAKRRDGSAVVVQRDWPALSIAPRFGPAPPGATPNFELDENLPVPTYRVGPTGLALGLDAAAAVLAAFGCWILAREALRRRPVRVTEIPPLARALNFVRESKSRPIDDRRRAAGLLARTLADDPDPSLSVTAAGVAWSPSEPQPDRLEELAQTVETVHERNS
jgi:hypothetical protein